MKRPMSYTVRIYGDHPATGEPGALLEEDDFYSGLCALEAIAAALGDGYTAELLATT